MKTLRQGITRLIDRFSGPKMQTARQPLPAAHYEDPIKGTDTRRAYRLRDVANGHTFSATRFSFLGTGVEATVDTFDHEIAGLPPVVRLWGLKYRDMATLYQFLDHLYDEATFLSLPVEVQMTDPAPEVEEALFDSGAENRSYRFRNQSLDMEYVIDPSESKTHRSVLAVCRDIVNDVESKGGIVRDAAGTPVGIAGALIGMDTRQQALAYERACEAFGVTPLTAVDEEVEA